MTGFSLVPKAEVYDAEILGLCGGLEAALTSPMVGLISGIHICTLGLYQTDLNKRDFGRFKEAAQRLGPARKKDYRPMGA